MTTEMPVHEMRECCHRVSRSTGVTFIDLYQNSRDLLKQHDVTEILSDGIHFKPLLSHLLFKLLVTEIENL